MQLNQFRFLIAVDKYGSISKAAQELYISQSTISLSLINLEEELGHVLLNRSKRGVTLTPEGKEVLKRATVIQDAIESLRDISADEETIIGDVRIGGSSHLAMNIITDAMLQLKRQYEGVHVFAQRDEFIHRDVCHPVHPSCSSKDLNSFYQRSRASSSTSR